MTGSLNFGLTPILLLSLVMTLGYFIYRFTVSSSVSLGDRLGLSLAVVAVVMMILPIRFSFGSLWRIPWSIAPGAQAIRAIDRIGLLAGFLSCLAIAFAIRALLNSTRGTSRSRRHLEVAVLLVLTLAVLEQYNNGIVSRIDRHAEMAMLDGTPAPPPECRAFFITVPKVKPPIFYIANIDAMLISQRVKIPTVNGYSGQVPPNYGAVVNPSSPAYRASVDRWIKRNGIADGMCTYDLGNKVWSPYTAS